jgi:hypothetical protein
MRVPLMILSALGAGLVAGRKLLGKEISGRKSKAIESAVQEARHRIRADTMLFVTRSFRTFAIATGIKLAILCWLWGLHHFAGMPRPIFATLTVITLAVFMIRDLWINYPAIRLTLTELHRHGWHPKRALTETIAARVFEEVLAEAGNQKQTRTGAIMLMLAGEDRSQMHHDVATAVADIARENDMGRYPPVHHFSGGEDRDAGTDLQCQRLGPGALLISSDRAPRRWRSSQPS